MIRYLLLPLAACALLASSPAHASPYESDASSSASSKSWSPLRVHLICQSYGRTKACPQFLRGFVDENELLKAAPRAAAQVTLYVNSTSAALDDKLHLRFVSKLGAGPQSFEVEQSIDTRSSDDQQRAALRPAFQRGLAPFLQEAIPGSVTVLLAAPSQEMRKEKDKSSPWSASLSMGGFGSWTDDYKDASGHLGLGFSRLTRKSSLSFWSGGSYSLSRQPPLVVGDESISLDVESYALQTRLNGSYRLSEAITVGGLARGARDDPEGQYAATVRGHLGASYDHFPADDPRGNRLAIGYFAGAQYDDYNRINVLGQDRVAFLSHALLATGSVRKDKLTYSLTARAMSQIDAPRDRYLLELNPNFSIQLGDHVDLDLGISVTKQAVPGPADIDETDFEELTRASYAQALSVDGYLNIVLHLDRDNGVRNNRMSIAGQLGSRSPL